MIDTTRYCRYIFPNHKRVIQKVYELLESNTSKPKAKVVETVPIKISNKREDTKLSAEAAAEREKKRAEAEAEKTKQAAIEKVMLSHYKE